MQQILFSSLAIIFCLSNLSGQINVDSDQNENRYVADMTVIGETAEDLYFSISPDGRPQYGNNVAWNLRANTDDDARFYYAKKGDYERDSLLEERERVKFFGTPPFPPSSTPNIDMEGLYVRLSTSWNFASDNFNIAIVSVHNPGTTTINKGFVNLKVPNSMGATIDEVKVYAEWAHILSQENTSDHIIQHFQINDLAPKEIRHLYLYIEVPRVHPKFKFKRHTFQAEFEGYGTSEITTDMINPPHDPNELVLLTGISNSMVVENCGVFEEHEELYTQCAEGLPYWFDGEQNCATSEHPPCDVKSYTFEYPYCAEGSEYLEYRIQCLNDGLGSARHIGKKVFLSGDDFTSPFKDETFEFTGSTHPVSANWAFPIGRFDYDNIYLPGLNDPKYVRTYDECSAFATFKISTKCHSDVRIKGHGAIEFFDENEESVGVVNTSVVATSPNESPTYQFYQQCIPCFDKDNKKVVPTNPFTIEQSAQTIYFSSLANQEDGPLEAHIYHISGKHMATRQFAVTEQNERLSLSTERLSPGVYILALRQGQNTVSKKFIIP